MRERGESVRREKDVRNGVDLRYCFVLRREIKEREMLIIFLNSKMTCIVFKIEYIKINLIFYLIKLT